MSLSTAELVAVIEKAAAGATLTDEYDLQTAIVAALDEAIQYHGGPVREVLREQKLDDAGTARVDIWIDGPYWLAPGVVVEVKVAGSLASVVRQLQRYAANHSVGELILVTTRAKHHNVPRQLNGKPVHLVSLVEGGL